MKITNSTLFTLFKLLTSIASKQRCASIRCSSRCCKSLILCKKFSSSLMQEIADETSTWTASTTPRHRLHSTVQRIHLKHDLRLPLPFQTKKITSMLNSNREKKRPTKIPVKTSEVATEEEVEEEVELMVVFFLVEAMLSCSSKRSLILCASCTQSKNLIRAWSKELESSVISVVN